MSEEDPDSKVHEATPRKLEEARKKGETPASQEIVSAAVFAGLVLSVAGFGQAAISRSGAALSALFSPGLFLDGSALLGGAVAEVAAFAGWSLLAPLLVLSMAVAILGYVAQGTVTLAPKKIAPKLNRISPLSGAKQKFGREGLFNFAKSFGKLVIYSAILAFVVAGSADRIIHASHLSTEGLIAEASSLIGRFLVAAALAMMSFGLIDLLWQRHSFGKRQRMTQNELKDETKESEGDPHQKGARRQRARELAQTGNLSEARDADVVIVNPTHYAVALKWQRGAGTAPVCIAKGTDVIAGRIRQIANENGVPIRSDPPTARLIFATVAIGEEIRPDQYRAVAAAIRFADAIRGAKRGGERKG